MTRTSVLSDEVWARLEPVSITRRAGGDAGRGARSMDEIAAGMILAPRR